MIVLLDKALHASNLDAPTAVALLAPGQDELVIHIHQCLDPTPHPAGAAIALRGILENQPPAGEGQDDVYTLSDERGGGGLRPTAEGGSAHSDAVPTIKPTIDVSRTSPPLMRDLAGSKDTLGAIERDAATLAASYGCELHPAPRGEYTLVTRVGTTTHASLSAALTALKPPVEYLLDRLDAVTVKPTPVAPTEPAMPLAGAFGTRLDVEVPVLPEGCSLNAIRYVAHLLGVQVQASKTGSVLLTGQFGSKVFTSHARAASALNKRAWT